MDKKTQLIISRAYFIGGSPCSGKSTTAEILSRRYGLEYCRIDDYEREHLEQADPERHPVMYSLSQMSWDEIWMRPVAKQVEEEFEFYRERFEMVLDELKRFSGNRGIIVEGANLLPELLWKLEVDHQRVIYLIPSREFQIKHYSERNFITGILHTCRAPEEAFENWMARDHLFGRLLGRQAEKLEYRVMTVDGTNSPEENAALIAEHFNLTCE